MSEGLPNAFMQPPFSQNARPSSVGGWPVQTPTKDPSQIPHGEGHTVDMYSTPPHANGSSKVTQPFWTQERTVLGQQAAASTAGVDDLPTAAEIDDKAIDA